MLCFSQLHDILQPSSAEGLDDVYLVTDLMDTDLGQLLSSGQQLGTHTLTMAMYQTMCLFLVPC